MGQKVNPIGMRVTVNKNWQSRWFADKKIFGEQLIQDLKIRDLVKKRLVNAAVSDVVIERYANRARVTIFTARPGIVVGRKGQDIDRLREEIAAMSGNEIYVEIREVKNPDANAQLVAENIAVQLCRRVSFRRAMKKAIQLAMSHAGVLGVKVQARGRLGGAELSRGEWYKEGKVPLHTFRRNIEYGFAEAPTTAGRIGVKVWICKDDVEESDEKRVRGRSNAAYA
ncbi:MAG: 30S ribosomal protein S3 [Kiritimatiellae bacterium]|nr:30S ribosomal protein S3 [Kiritimatiellia bacterium]